ncbi:hypothetical protein MVEN_01127500 [Mycena venus]|uniref:Ubiquitin 3 binding protein But2 C-terminal domain-containing protein n=1 Tax=Mycena venus TaxID=2733690 RepID=A0A8H7D002_9AGAR|nr:hypothetical protein MVEN_01127500 [Mycena venus]
MASTHSSDMQEYTLLMSAAPEDGMQDEIELKSRKHTEQQHSPRFLMLLSVLITLVAIGAAAAFHLSVLSDDEPLLTPKEITSSFRMALPSPNLEKGRDIMMKKKYKLPEMIFPTYITRVNAAVPDTVYESGHSVILSPTDSMIYHWMTNSPWQMCYISGFVSPSELLVAGNKSYRSEGDLSAIEIWNVTTPANTGTLTALSWNTRPARISLLGTVNFTSVEAQRRTLQLDGQELRPPTPRFHCLGETEITVEVACKACHLEFEQVFSTPPLGFELLQLA